MCTPWPYVNVECLAGGRGLLPWEFNHFSAQHVASDKQRQEAIIHAVHHEHEQHETVTEDHFGLAEHVVEIDAGSELDDLLTLQHQPIILLDNLIHVIFPHSMEAQRQSYDTVCDECTVLNTEAYTAIFDLNGDRGKVNMQPMAHLGLSHQPATLRQGRLHSRVTGIIHS